MYSSAIQERSKTKLAQIKLHLHIDQDDKAHDVWLLDALKEAKSEADGYCSNKFLDADGNELDIPPHVERWIKETVARWFHNGENGRQSFSVQGEGSFSYGPIDYTGLEKSWKPFI